MEEFSNQKWECDFTTHPTTSPLVGVFIESRNHPKIGYALRNFSCMLPWASLHIMHSNANKAIIEQVTGLAKNITIEQLPEPYNAFDCNTMKLSPEFWKKFIKFHRILIFNVDTGIKQNSILRFLHFDYIGARWYHNPWGNESIYQGNGGFSLRNPKLMYEIITKFPCPYDNTKAIDMPEDMWFTKMIHDHFPNACMPNPAECELFSTETRDLACTFGFHDVDTYFPNAKKAYKVMEGPYRKLINIKTAYIDGVVNVLPLIKLGTGPMGTRIFKETYIGPGSSLNIDEFSFKIENGYLLNDVFIKPTHTFHVFYRITDNNETKPRPHGFCKRKVFENFIRIFGVENLHVIADSVTTDTVEWLRSKCHDVELTAFKNGGDSFCHSLKRAIEKCEKTDLVYFVEDDYFHMDNSKKLLEEGLDIADYATLYDHPDKYSSSGPNPFIYRDGEATLVRKTKSVHWKYTNSTTLTFACKVNTIYHDYQTHVKWCAEGKSMDFNLFMDLLDQGRTLVSSIPGYSTHLHLPWLCLEPSF